MKKALPEVNLAQLLITGTKAKPVPGSIGHRVPFLAAGRARDRRATPASVGKRGRVDERPARLGIEPVDPLGAVGPGDLAERLAVEEFAGLAVQAIEVAVAMRLHERLDRLAVPVDVDQDRLVHAVIIPDVVGAVLEMPLV